MPSHAGSVHPAESGGSTSLAGGGSSGRAHGGSSGHGAAAGKRAVAEGGADENAAGQAGASGAAPDDGGAGGNGSGGASNGGSAGLNAGGAATKCDPQQGCGSDCTEQHATCSVISAPACEFTDFIGVSADLTCGRTHVVGSANCGGCGLVDVELFFDGEHCWEGIPSCPLSELTGEFAYPHLPDGDSER